MPDWLIRGHSHTWAIVVHGINGTPQEGLHLLPALRSAFASELPRWVTYYRSPHAGHTQSWNVDPPLYERRLNTFLAYLE